MFREFLRWLHPVGDSKWTALRALNQTVMLIIGLILLIALLLMVSPLGRVE